jgi:effector-binding domain-containing protein
MEAFEIVEADFPEEAVVSVRTKDALGAMGKHIGALYKIAREKGIKPAGPIFAVYWEKPVDPAKVDYSLYLPVEGKTDALDKCEDFGGDPCLKLRLRGSYSQFGAAYAALEAEVGKRGLEMSAPPREVYVRGPFLGFMTFIPTMVTDIYFPVKR